MAEMSDDDRLRDTELAVEHAEQIEQTEGEHEKEETDVTAEGGEANDVGGKETNEDSKMGIFQKPLKPWRVLRHLGLEQSMQAGRLGIYPP